MTAIGGVNKMSPALNCASIGERVREVRRRKGVTIPSLAQLSGLSPGFLSQAETGKISLSLDSLARIADALGLCSGDLLEAPPAAPSVVRAAERPRVRRGQAPEVEYLAPLWRAQHVHAAIVKLQPGGMAGGCDHAHAGEELAWVLNGHVRVLQGDTETEVGEGDSALIDPRIPHTYEAVGPQDARLLLVSTPPADLQVSR